MLWDGATPGQSQRESRVTPTTVQTSWAPTPRPSWRNGLVLIAFWLALFTAAGFYAAAALSPKLLSFCQLQHEYQTQQIRLLQLEQQTEQLRQVVDALDHDPAFIEELTRWELASHDPREEIIPVDANLILQPNSDAPLIRRSLTAIPPTWLPLLQTVSTSDSLRWLLLFAAATLVLVAFTWLQDRSERHLPGETPAGSHAPGNWWQRYRKSPTE